MSVGMIITLSFFAFGAFLAIITLAWVLINKSRGRVRTDLSERHDANRASHGSA